MMTDREFLERIKSLYEKDGGMILRLAERWKSPDMDFEEPGRTEERKDGTDSGEMEGADPEIVSKGVPLGDCHGLG